MNTILKLIAVLTLLHTGSVSAAFVQFSDGDVIDFGVTLQADDDWGGSCAFSETSPHCTLGFKLDPGETMGVNMNNRYPFYVLAGLTTGPYGSGDVLLLPNGIGFPPIIDAGGSFGFFLDGNIQMGQTYWATLSIYGNYEAYDYFSAGGESSLLMASAVPVPAALWLFGSGLLGLVGVARRKAA